MSQKIKEIYACNKCGAQSNKWNGRCFECGAWGTLVKETMDQRTINKQEVKAEPADFVNLTNIKEEIKQKMQTNIGEIDRVFGGGIVAGSLTLLSGEPGAGKSTILAQIANAIKADYIYVSGEESATQVKNRFERLKCDINRIKFISETNVEKIMSAIIKQKPKLAIIDSIQTVYSSLTPSEPGSIQQIRASTIQFMEIAKKHDIAIIIIGHITKDGQIAGPKTLEHIVDTVMYLESERVNDFHVLKTTKNRFGSVNEIGLFEMTGLGFKEIKNPSALFVELKQNNITGSVISIVMEGTRPFLVEIQALVTKTVFGYPQRKASGFDSNRLQVLTAVLTKRAGINLSNQDVILNIVGGLKINDPGLDLAVCLAIVSSLLNQSIDRKTVVLGEVGLGGEVRNVGKIKERLREAEKLGIERAIVPEMKASVKGIELQMVKVIKDYVEIIKG